MTDQPPCTTSGTVPEPRCRIARPCDPSQPEPAPMSLAPPPTAPWCGTLSEKVKASAYHITTSMDTILKVRTSQADPTRYSMEYGLCESRKYKSCDDTCANPMQVCPYCDTDWCAVERDCGQADVQPASLGSAVLHGSKQLQFKSGLTPDLNAWAQIALKVMVEEVASATCRPPSCAGATGSACPSTSGEGSTPSDTQCTCPGPYDSCTLLTELDPKDSPALCPSGGE